MDSSDSEDCQLYTRAAENVRLKQEYIRLPAVLHYHDNELNTVESSPSKGVLNNIGNSEIGDSQVGVHEEHFDLHSVGGDEEIPLSERTTRKRRKYDTNSVKKSKKRKLTRSSNNSSNYVGVGETNNIVLDDDQEFSSLPPINFNSQYSVKPALVDNTDFLLHSSTSNEDSDYEVDNSVTLTVEWNNGCNLTRREFKLDKYDKLATVFKSLSELEGLTPSRVFLMHNLATVHPNDTPHSLNIKFYGALTGSVSSTDINYNELRTNESDLESNVNSISVKMQMDTNESVTLNIMKNQHLRVLFKRCSELLKCEENQLRIIFDGENVRPDDILSNLDIENDDVLHVYKNKRQ